MKKVIPLLIVFLFLLTNVVIAGGDGMQTEVLAKTGASWNGALLPTYPTGTPEITILRINVPPGMQLPLHSHPVINAAVLLRGELTVLAENNKTLHVKAGDALVEVVNNWHYGKNEGKEPAEILVFYAGVKDSPITLKK